MCFLWMPLSAFALQCPIDPLARYTELGGDVANERVDVTANQSQANYHAATFTGQVTLQQGDKHLFSPQLTYNRHDHQVETVGNTVFASPQLAVSGENADYDLAKRIIALNNVRYYLKSEAFPAIGQAQSVQFDVDKQTTTLTDPTWSTCPRDNQVWSLKASQLTVDRLAKRAIARDATFRIKGVPIFFVPYFSFPTSDARATGFLSPSIQLNESNGLALDIPYYWNIAPNQDATFNLRPMSKRGFMLGGQYRYLGTQQQAQVSGTILPQDRNERDQKRWSLRADYQYHFNEHWHSDVLFQQVSDLDYVNDFSNDLSLYDQWFLERHAAITGNTDMGHWLFRVQDYERVSRNVSPEHTPYARLPQLRYDTHGQQNGWSYDLTAESVRFDKRDAVSGWRNSIDGALAYRWAQDYGYLEPKISVNIADYRLHDNNDAYPKASFTRAVPTFSLDGKLEFERPLYAFGQHWTQTLEPHLFYLYTPYHEQNAAPNFDSSLRSQSWNWLFARNRFVGGDRIGDANQLTTAVTTRFFDDKEGQERLRLSLGQIQYFTDRKVTLPGNPVRERGHSDLIVEGAYQVDRHWHIRGLGYWDIDKHHNRRNILDIRYNLDANRFAGISHRYEKDNYDQLSVFASWRINPSWRTFVRQDYSLRHQRAFNTLAGVEYDDCCWAWRLLGKRYRDNPTAPKLHNALYLEFVFKGLGRLGNGAGSVLANEISGYQPLAEERSF